jgi:4-hydroxybenzoate polyprenyltransferase
VKLATALRLGRVSNLPTTWTNVAAGIALAGASAPPAVALVLCLAISCFYVGGMYLNDAFDRDYDARERPERPIPSGAVSARSVLAIGFGLLAAGVVLVALLALGGAGQGLAPIASALALAALIVIYDLHHKANPWSPLLMAGNRVLVYVTAAQSVRVGLPLALLWGCLCLLAYLIGLTYIAKQENLRALPNLWPLLFLAVPFGYLPALESPVGIALYCALAAATGSSLRQLFGPGRNVKAAVSRLIAGISLCDALLIAGQGQTTLAALCVLGFALTLLFQRVVPGT